MTIPSPNRGFAWDDLGRAHLVAWRYGMSHFSYRGDAPIPRGMLVGEAPGPRTDARLPMFPVPHTSAAGRLLKYADVLPEDWIGLLLRVNLCDGQWSDRRAAGGVTRALAHLLAPANYHDGKPLRVLLLGRRVRDAWACDGTSFGFERRRHQALELQIAWIPHPSGKCLLYNERSNQLRARRAVLWLLGKRATP